MDTRTQMIINYDKSTGVRRRSCSLEKFTTLSLSRWHRHGRVFRKVNKHTHVMYSLVGLTNLEKHTRAINNSKNDGDLNWSKLVQFKVDQQGSLSPPRLCSHARSRSQERQTRKCPLTEIVCDRAHSPGVGIIEACAGVVVAAAARCLGHLVQV